MKSALICGLFLFVLIRVIRGSKIENLLNQSMRVEGIAQPISQKVERHDRYKDHKSGDQDPWVLLYSACVDGCAQHIPPTGLRFTDTQPE